MQDSCWQRCHPAASSRPGRAPGRRCRTQLPTAATGGQKWRAGAAPSPSVVDQLRRRHETSAEHAPLPHRTPPNPRHSPHFCASGVGVWMMNSSVAGSKVAVVCISTALLPARGGGVGEGGSAPLRLGGGRPTVNVHAAAGCAAATHPGRALVGPPGAAAASSKTCSLPPVHGVFVPPAGRSHKPPHQSPAL